MAKKSQMKMGETVAVLVVFFILIMVAMVFYTDFKKTSIEKKRLEAQELKGIEIANMISFLPEIKCSDYMCVGCTDAIDIIKLRMMIDGYDLPIVLNNRLVYVPQFIYSSISVKLIYPEMSTGLLEDMGYTEKLGYPADYVFNGVWQLYDEKREKSSYNSIFIPVNLYNAYTDECYFGVLNVSVYET